MNLGKCGSTKVSHPKKDVLYGGKDEVETSWRIQYLEEHLQKLKEEVCLNSILARVTHIGSYLSYIGRV